MYYVAHFRSFQ